MLSQRRQKEIARLRQRKYRERDGAFLVEGVRAVQSAVDGGAEVIDLIVERRRADDADFAAIVTQVGDLMQADATVVDVKVVDEPTMARLSDVMASQGVLAVVRMPDRDASRLVGYERVLALDGVQDPGNAGTLIRTAAWFGIDGVLAGAGTVDFFNPKVVRSSMGGTFDVALAATDNLAAWLREAKGRGVKVYAADMDGTTAEAWHPVAPSVLVVGNEGSGLSSDVAACVDERITIAKVNGGGRGVESLNVAQAASILGYLWTRRAT